MQIQAYFEDIQKQIIHQVQSAKRSVFVAVAWLTDRAIFSELCTQAKKGIQVELILLSDEINNEYTHFDHYELQTNGGRVYKLQPNPDGSIMHHKFCIIDECTIITGSYNWSRKAQQNDENIVVTTEAFELGAQFKKEFDSIKGRVAGATEEIAIDYNKIIKRLEVIKNFTALEEKEEIAAQIKKLKAQTLPPEVSLIVAKFDEEQFATALKLTSDFIQSKNRIAVYDDFELFGLQLELRSLEIQVNALENELVEAEKLVHEFLVRHTKELGALILDLLELQKISAKTEEEKAEAEEDERTYREGYEANKNTVIPELTEDEKKKLNKMYREASMLCHPDRFANEPIERQKQAEELFKELADSYSGNDTNRVQEILHRLKNGILLIDPKNAPDKKDTIKTIMETLKNKSVKITQRIKEIKETDVYKTATINSDWDVYFMDAKENLRKQIENLKVQHYG